MPILKAACLAAHLIFFSINLNAANICSEYLLRGSFTDLNEVDADHLQFIFQNTEVDIKKPKQMADRIIKVAQGNSVHPGFSEHVHKLLVSSLEIYFEADLLGFAASLPFMNEKLRRSHLPPLTLQELIGVNVYVKNPFTNKEEVLDEFGNPIKNLRTMELRYLNLQLKNVREKTKNDRLWLAEDQDLFLKIGLAYSHEKAKSFPNQSVRNLFDLIYDDGKLHPELTYWLYQTLIREKFVREFIVEEIFNRRLKWYLNIQRMDRHILLMAAYPELLSFYKRISNFNFQKNIDFTSFEGISTDFSALKEDPTVLAKFSLKKVVNPTMPLAPIYYEVANTYIDLTIANPTDKDFNLLSKPKSESIEKLVLESWQGFAKDFDLMDIEIYVTPFERGDIFPHMELTVTLNIPKNYKYTQTEVLGSFYLSLIDGRRLNYKGKEL